MHACGRRMTYKKIIDCSCMNVFVSNTVSVSINHLLCSFLLCYNYIIYILEMVILLKIYQACSISLANDYCFIEIKSM